MKNASSQKEDQLHLSVYSALEGLGISMHKSKKARSKRRRSLAKGTDIARGRLCSTSCEKEDYPFIASPKQKLFGIVLNSVEWDMDCSGFYAPKFLIMATEYLLVHQKCEGIFRKPGASNRLKALKILLEDGGNFSSVGVSHVYDVACILKQWLRELPEPLIPYTFHEMFLTCYDIQQEEDRLKALCLACLLLPSEHLRTLMYILKFLSVIAQQDANKMDAQNLALVMSPCLMPLPKFSMDGETTKLLLESRTQIIKLLIKHADVVGKTDWLEETLIEGYNAHNELTQRKTKTKSTSKTVHGIFHNLRKKIGHVQSPSPQQRSLSSKFEKPLFHSQRRERQKSKKALHSPCTLTELGDVVNVPKTAITPLKASSTGSPLKPSKASTGSSGNETANNSSDGNSFLSPLLNITNSSFTKDSPFSRPNKFRLENERAWLQLNSNQSSEESHGTLNKDSKEDLSKLRSEALEGCDMMATPVCPARPCCRRSQSLQCGSSTERQMAGTSRSGHKLSNISKKSHYMKAKYRRDSWHNIKNVSNLMRSASSPTSCLEILRATSELEKRAAVALKESYRNTLMSDLLSCTETKSALRRGRPNTRSSGLPSPTWTRSVPCDFAEITVVETTPGGEVSTMEDKLPTLRSPDTYAFGDDNHKDKNDSVQDSLQSLGSSEVCSPSKEGVIKNIEHSLENVEAAKKQETAPHPAVKRNDSTPLVCTQVQAAESKPPQVTPTNEVDRGLTDGDRNLLSVPWTDARAYFRIPERPRAAKTHTGVRESILMLRTQHAGKVQANVQLFDSMSRTFSVPAVRRAPSGKSRNRHSFSLKATDGCASVRNKSLDGKSPLGSSKVFPTENCTLTRCADAFVSRNARNAPIPRALFNRSSDLIDKEAFSSTENLISPNIHDSTCGK